ncbi:uncharacterized protein LOC133710920 isoform X2 [Rosa rugosa]|uniref:uncharacterized protein LOC133710920 isoform X2 n=1 Tax=Rosa rugosa TaxID=74645 RepID=UPI002B40A68C|nr:uncharacterized protein LOC133710920 isoform X2 [Rosa rugosa]
MFFMLSLIMFTMPRIITPQALRSIWPLFKSELQGPYITWAQYPQDQLDKLFELWKNKNFKFDCSEEELKDVFTEHIKTRYSDWMSEIRNSVFRKHKTAAARYANTPSYLKPEIWTPIVDEWLKETWQEKSERNAINRDKSTMVHTTGSVPMAKYIKEEIDKTGVEPSPIEMFRRFHISKPKDGKPEHWQSEKAKDLYECMELQKRIEETLGGDGEDELDDWDIYKEVVGGSKHGKIRGLGDGMEPPEDVCGSSSRQTCNKRVCLERDKEFGQLEQQVHTLTDMVADLKQVLQAFMANSSSHSQFVRESPFSPASTNGDSETHAP